MSASVYRILIDKQNMLIRSKLALNLCFGIGFTLHSLSCALTAAQAAPLAANERSLRYTVQIDDKGLNIVSMRLYGTKDEWQTLAKINRIRKPYRIHSGQKLKLHKPRILSPAAGDVALVTYYRNILNDSFSESPHESAHEAVNQTLVKSESQTGGRSIASVPSSGEKSNQDFLTLSEGIRKLQTVLNNQDSESATALSQAIVSRFPEAETLPFIKSARELKSSNSQPAQIENYSAMEEN